MADDRAISNPLALAVLVLLYERPMHPYEMATTLRDRRKEDSIKLRFGSLYSVIDRMERENWIVAGETVQEGNRPPRTVYHITDHGIAEMRDWLLEIVRSPAKEYPRFEAGLSLLAALPPDEAVDMLEVRTQKLAVMIEEIDSQIEQAGQLGIPALFTIEDDYRREMLRAEQDWVRRLIERMVNERWADVRIPGELPSWRQLHAEREGGTDAP